LLLLLLKQKPTLLVTEIKKKTFFSGEKTKWKICGLCGKSGMRLKQNFFLFPIIKQEEEGKAATVKR
jgi:hypothetical protein